MTHHHYIAFCDFDGTITNWETSEGGLKYLLGEARFNEKMKYFMENGYNTSKGIKELFSLIPSVEYPRIQQYISEIEIRPGFTELLRCLDERGIPFVVVSGGTGEMVRAVLGPYFLRFAGCYYCHVDTTGDYLSISSEFDDGVDLMRKEKVMSLYSYDYSIFIGDSYTDRNASLSADIVFARDRLDAFLAEQHLPHYTFETFHDVIAEVERMDIRNTAVEK